MKKAAVLMLLLASTSLFAARLAPIYEGNVKVLSNKSMVEIEKAIKKALVGKGWEIESVKKGQIDALIHVRSHTAMVKVVYTKEEVKIVYKDSDNLKYKEKSGVGMIHRNYNNWIKHLEKHIRHHLIG